MRYLSAVLALLLLAPSTIQAQVIEWGKVTSDFWSSQHHSPSYGYWDYSSRTTAVDKHGNLYTCGRFLGKSQIGDSVVHSHMNRAFIAKLAPSGELLWMRTEPVHYLSSNYLALDSLGGVYYQSYFLGDTAVLEGRVVYGGSKKRWSSALWRLDTSGEIQWSKLIANYRDTSAYLDLGVFWKNYAPHQSSMEADRSGNVYIYTIYEDSIQTNGVTYRYPRKRAAVLMKYAKDGGRAWMREMPKLDSLPDLHKYPFYAPTSSLAVTRSGHAYIGVRTYHGLQFDDQFFPQTKPSVHQLVKVSPVGAVEWKRDFAFGENLYTDIPRYELSVDAEENLYFLGSALFPLHFGDTVLKALGLAQIDSSGKLEWARPIRPWTSLGAEVISGESMLWKSLSVNGYGQMAVTFYAWPKIVYDRHVLEYNQSQGDKSRTVVMQLNDRGELIWGDFLESATYNFASSISMLPDHGVYITGGFDKKMFARDSLTSPLQTYYGGFIVKYRGVDLMTPSPGKLAYCAGDTVRVLFNATRKFHPGNTYRAQLSDTSGAFTQNVQVLGQITTDDSVGVIDCVLPKWSVPGSTYRVKVTGTDPYFDASVPGPEFTIYGPPPAKIRAKSTKLCVGEVMDLTGLGGASYRWSNGDTSTTINIDKAGRYILTAYNEIGCEASDTITIESVPVPNALSQATGPTTFCEGGQVRLRASGGTSYRWSNDETTQEIVVRGSGIYTATVTNSAGCSKQTTPITVTVLDAPEKPVIARDSNQLTSSSDSLNQWYKNGQMIKDATGKTYEATQTGRYSVRVTYENGCFAESDAINVTIGGGSNVIAALATARFEVMYSSEPIIILEAESPQNVTIEVIDQLGSSVAVLVDDMISGARRMSLPSYLPSGMYYVRATANGEVRTLKLTHVK
ncbi:MAG TPA: hypothetical protein VFH43_11500 [Candidatus Kapabacteria bacterium]|nr:hypothetical protein [Candidatus Kapabacteria bacterium]